MAQFCSLNISTGQKFFLPPSLLCTGFYRALNKMCQIQRQSFDRNQILTSSLCGTLQSSNGIDRNFNHMSGQASYMFLPKGIKIHSRFTELQPINRDTSGSGASEGRAAQLLPKADVSRLNDCNSAKSERILTIFCRDMGNTCPDPRVKFRSIPLLQSKVTQQTISKNLRDLTHFV